MQIIDLVIEKDVNIIKIKGFNHERNQPSYIHIKDINKNDKIFLHTLHDKTIYKRKYEDHNTIRREKMSTRIWKNWFFFVYNNILNRMNDCNIQSMI